MSDIILSTQNGQAVVSSREVAERFGKNHKDVLRAMKIWRRKIAPPNPCSTKPRLKTVVSSTPCT